MIVYRNPQGKFLLEAHPTHRHRANSSVHLAHIAAFFLPEVTCHRLRFKYHMVSSLEIGAPNGIKNDAAL